jgi:hypothetical protein
MKARLIKSPKPVKKWRVILEDGSHVDFGQKGYSDYTKHKDPARMRRYLQRHARMHENWRNPRTAGFWSRWLLWSKPNLEEAKKLVARRFRIRFSA